MSMSRIFNLFRTKRTRMEHDLERELRYHLDRRAQDLMGSGLSEQAARRSAAMEFDGLSQVQEEVRDTWLWGWLQDLGRGLSEVRFAVHMMRRQTGMTLLAITALALGIDTPAGLRAESLPRA